ncbi:MAG: acyltransferase [Ignavibacteria bacterium]|jgi:galactoside O-acetyltransferase|nr:acyltransferase [Ignavibacteria bacterium]MCU7503340.1 acyltransferase [Ignavibacteria bacterium]MCU7515714.1 acyltransferase [Ignavibacteria bacterium]
MTTSFYEEEELRTIGFRKFGNNVKLSRKASIYNPEEISIGDNVRIDDYCILSGNITIGSYIHISAYTALYGKFGIVLEDFVTISGRVLVYSQTDDYGGDYMTNPTVPEEYLHVTGGLVHFQKHSIVAAGCIIFPGVTLHEGAAIGAMSMVNKDVPAWTISVGIPAKPLKGRNNKLLELEKKLKSKLFSS